MVIEESKSLPGVERSELDTIRFKSLFEYMALLRE